MTFQPHDNGEFSLVLRWLPGDRTFTQEFTRAYCFGASYTLPPVAWAVEKKVCDYARAVVRAVLEQHNVI